MYRFDNLAACSTFVLTMIALYTRVTPGLTAFLLNSAYHCMYSVLRGQEVECPHKD